MTSRERIGAILHRQGTGSRPGFWSGNPNETSIEGICAYYGVESLDAVRAILKDEILWIPADKAYVQDKDGWTVFDGWEGACLGCETAEDLDRLPWPDPCSADFSRIVAQLAASGDRYRLSGMWAPFFHDISAFMGMEEYFIAMYERPEFVHALTERLIDFYCEANRRFFVAAADELDGYFFGNDLGSQISTLVSPHMFRTFLMPYMQRLVDTARECALTVVLHSCGAISPLIGEFIAMGVDAIHPVQVKAEGMDCSVLKQFKDRIAFIGGIDTQELLRTGTEDEIAREVLYLYEELGPNIIISPSHESILPDVPPKNLKAISDTVYCI